MLAKTVAHSVEMLADKPHSLASQLLQGIFSERRSGERPINLLAKTVCQDFASLVPSTSRMLSTTLLSLITSFNQPSSGMLPHLIARSIR